MKVSENPSENNQQNRSRKKLGVTIGTTIGLLPMGIVAANFLIPMNDAKIVRRKKFLSNFFTEIDSFETIKKYADDIIKKNTTQTKGLKIEITTPETIKKLIPIKINPKKPAQKFLYNIIENFNKMFSNGLNACFNPLRNSVWINNKSLYSCVFHEIGHGLNYHSKLTKPLFFLRGLCQATLPLFDKICLGIGIVGIKHQSKQEQEKTKSEKTREFICNNAGKLVFLYSLPILSEELLATLRGFKLSKKYLTPAQQKIHIKNQAMGLLSYALLLSLMSGAITLGIYTKNKIVQNKNN